MNLALFGDRQFATGSRAALIHRTAPFGGTGLLPVSMQIGLQLLTARQARERCEQRQRPDGA